MNQEPKSWEARYDDLEWPMNAYGPMSDVFGMEMYERDKQLKDFIQSEISKAKEEGAREVLEEAIQSFKNEIESWSAHGVKPDSMLEYRIRGNEHAIMLLGAIKGNILKGEKE